jgi:lysophospholipase L1-like esterase
MYQSAEWISEFPFLIRRRSKMISPWKILSRAVLGTCLMTGFVSVSVAADAPKTDTPKVKAPPKAPAPHEAADVPNPKHDPKNPTEPQPGFVKRHEGFLKDLAAKNGKVGILFVGDSITDGWRNGGKKVFEATYGALDPLNIGIGGDRTQHVLWRLDHGEVEGISPKVAVVMIGTNNLGSNTDEEIEAGVTRVVRELNEKLPKTKVLLLAIFPRGGPAVNDKDPEKKKELEAARRAPTAPVRARLKAINDVLAKLDDGGKTVKYLDIGPKFLDAEGNLPADVMPDALHPNAKGYQIWADGTASTLAELMK